MQVSKPGGFDGPIDVAMPTAYLQMLDENGFHPDPAEATADARWTRWTFDPPEARCSRCGSTCASSRACSGGATARCVEADGEVLEAGFETWIAP
ncbi:MAG: hypothetical protein R2746_14335 [Acidimicrobiales bacterium]